MNAQPDASRGTPTKNVARSSLCFVMTVLLAGVSPRTPASEGGHADVGPGLVVTPAYPGSDQQDVLPIPLVDIQYGRSLFLNSRQGFGVYFINGKALQLGASAGYRRGRDHEDDAILENLPDVDFAGVARLFVKYNAGPIVLGAAVGRDLGGSSGLTVDVDASWRITLSSRMHGSLGLQSSFGNDKFMQTWFGITPEQSHASGLTEHHASAGVKSVGATASLGYELTPRWRLTSAITYDLLMGDAADSPVVQRKGMPTFALGASYHFFP
jgi:outer membrane scaffolding protein for murein synthesis (MipA/OmpV family)